MRLQLLPFLYAIFASIAAVLLGVWAGKDTLQQALFMVRGTARVGVPLVLIIYTASATYKLWPNAVTSSIYKNRRSWGLAFALTHSVHLFAITHYLNQPGMIDPGPLGIIGYSFIYLMAFSSNTGSIKRLGLWWKRIHTMGVNIIWVYYMVAYTQMLFEPELRLVGITVIPLLLAALGIRLMAWQKTQRITGKSVDG
jgi:methionine sulfoxide reductase heme-binding subunit